ncbi:hypothetical protein ACF06X_34300 [Streptomyces sp. NPDC015346]|uniref:hypothetical protein n=1 Tax=Streptomyces sp. NPDC015346 TaxID=3364954 RepID=UPI0036FD6F40
MSSTLWRRVLTALADESLDDAERERILALGAAHLVRTRCKQEHEPTVEDVMTAAFHEFALLLDADTARAALREAARRG